MRTKGRFLFKSHWYSICSWHREYDENCNLCNHGRWINVYRQKFDSFMHDYFYKIWFWYVNRKLF